MTKHSASNSYSDSPLQWHQLSAQEAELLRQSQPGISIWQVLGLQFLISLCGTLLLWAAASNVLAASWAYGAMTCLLPNVVFARGVTRRWTAHDALTSTASFFLWELVKWALALAMMLAAPRVLNPLNWPGLLLGCFVVFKVQWVVMAWPYAKIQGFTKL
ncbi:MAG: ATP synthase subunit I [Betaproteobacteria bacterium]|nr:ATP synthase subunit I [Betaproteobacteria bacterium]